MDDVDKEFDDLLAGIDEFDIMNELDDDQDGDGGNDGHEEPQAPGPAKPAPGAARGRGRGGGGGGGGRKLPSAPGRSTPARTPPNGGAGGQPFRRGGGGSKPPPGGPFRRAGGPVSRGARGGGTISRGRGVARGNGPVASRGGMPVRGARGGNPGQAVGRGPRLQPAPPSSSAGGSPSKNPTVASNRPTATSNRNVALSPRQPSAPVTVAAAPPVEEEKRGASPVQTTTAAATSSAPAATEALRDAALKKSVPPPPKTNVTAAPPVPSDDSHGESLAGSLAGFDDGMERLGVHPRGSAQHHVDLEVASVSQASLTQLSQLPHFDDFEEEKQTASGQSAPSALPVAAVTAASAAATRKCPECGFDGLPGAAKHCGECGARLPPQVVAAAPSGASPRRDVSATGAGPVTSGSPGARPPPAEPDQAQRQPIIISIVVPATGASKKMRFSAHMTASDAILQASDVLVRSRLLASADVVPFLRLYKRANGGAKLKKLVSLDDAGVRSGDSLYLLDKRDKSGEKTKQFDRLVHRQGLRVDVVCPHAFLKDWGRSGPCASSLVSGASKIGYLVKEGSQVKSWKRRLFVLHNGILYYFLDDQSSHAKGFLALTRGSSVSYVEDTGKRAHVFSVRESDMGRVLYCQCQSTEERAEWRAALEQTVAQLRRPRPTGGASTSPNPFLHSPEDALIIDSFWLADPRADTVGQLVRRALRKAVQYGMAVRPDITEADQGFGDGAAAPVVDDESLDFCWRLHLMGGARCAFQQSLADVFADEAEGDAATALDGCLQLQLKSTVPLNHLTDGQGGGGGGGGTSSSSSLYSADTLRGASKKIAKGFGRAFSRTKKALSERAAGRPGDEDVEDGRGEGAGSSDRLSPRPPTTPVGVAVVDKAAARSAGQAMTLQGTNVQRLDVTVAKSKPKSAGRRPPTRKKRPV